MFRIELTCTLGVEVEHFKIRYSKFFLSGRNHLAKVDISIRLKHSVGPE
jgi:hypothetical protein